jgi:hypothetical protein
MTRNAITILQTERVSVNDTIFLNHRGGNGQPNLLETSEAG